MTGNKTTLVGSSILSVGVLLLCGLQLSAQDNPKPTFKPTFPTAFGVTESLRELAKIPQPMQYGFRPANPVRRIHKQNSGQVVDTAERSATFPSEFSDREELPWAGQRLPRIYRRWSSARCQPSVGDTQVLQWVNVSLTVCSKTGTTCGSADPWQHALEEWHPWHPVRQQQ